MPFIRVTANTALSETIEHELRSQMAECVKNILGKDPVRMMTAFEEKVHLCRGGNENSFVPAAFVECKFFGGDDYEAFEKFDSAMKKIFGQLLNITPDNLYIKYEVIDGWNEPPRIFKI